MPLFLAAVATIFLVSAIKGTLTTSKAGPGLLDLLRGDFVGQNNFLIWLAAIIGLGSLGYIKQIQPIVNAFLGLVILVLFLSHKGFFDQFVAAAKSTQTTPANTNEASGTPALPQLPALPTLLPTGP